MRVQMVGCSHHRSSDEVRGRLSFSPTQAKQALDNLRAKFPNTEAVLLSTCNRVEVYTASSEPHGGPTHQEVVEFLADFHGLALYEVFDELFERTGEDAVLHLFTVAASLDSMVVGEPQILAQVKQAYDLACERQSTGPVTHSMFQAALRVAKRVTSETSINQKRVSIPSIAVCDFARQVFERFDDKQTLVLGAGEMAEETIRYLQDEGAQQITICNRNLLRAEELASRWHGSARPWDQLAEALTAADVVVSTTAATEPVVTLDDYRQIEARRFQRPLFVLDLAMPRDFDPAIGNCLNVYLYSIGDLKEACQRNLEERQKEFPLAMKIVEEETAQFMQDVHHRATGPIIQRLKEGWRKPKDEELRRLFNKLPELDERSRGEIAQSFDRLINKLLHPPLESLRGEARNHGALHGLLDALRRLFQLDE